MLTVTCSRIFQRSIDAFHVINNLPDKEILNPYPEGTIENLLYLKNWIDSGQWALESLIRFNPDISAVEAFAVKKKIDCSNQRRTDVVEEIDSYFYERFKDVKALDDATVNTESLGWVIDRLSIQFLKIHHRRMQAKVENEQLSTKNVKILEEQKDDLMKAIEELLGDIAEGRKYMRVFKAIKMYNDPALNPVLYSTKKTELKNEYACAKSPQ